MSVLNNLPEEDLKNRSLVLGRIDAGKRIIQSRYGIHEFNTGVGGYIFAYDHPAWVLFDNSEKEYHDFRRMFPNLCMYNKAWDELIGIPTATSQIWTKRMAIERTRELTKQRAERLQNPNTFIVSSCSSVLPNIINDYILESLKQSEEQLKMKEYLFGAPKYVVSGDYIPFEWLRGNPNLGLVQPYCKIELNNEKEKEKMEAKKCERCGKLYELQDADDYISAYLPGLPVSDWNKENFTESRIRKDKTMTISVNLRGGQVVDLCPECREKLKNFFESGMDEKSVAVGLYGETVIKKAEE